jgi:hypothetical protein
MDQEMDSAAERQRPQIRANFPILRPRGHKTKTFEFSPG